MADSDPEIQFNTMNSCDETIEAAHNDDSGNEAEQTAYYTLPSATDTDEDDEEPKDSQQRCNTPMRNDNVNSSSGQGDNPEDKSNETRNSTRRSGRRVNFNEEIGDDENQYHGLNNRRGRRRYIRKPENIEQYSDSDEDDIDERRVHRRRIKVNRDSRRERYNTEEISNRNYELDTNDNQSNISNKRNKPNLPVIKPTIYDGTEDWESYFSHFSNCADLGRWSNEEKALTLASCLKGSARTFYLGLRPKEQRVYAILEQKLSERFGSSRQQTRYLTKFETRKRNIGEAVASYGDDLRLLARRAYPDLGTEAQESLALHQLYKNISLDLKYRCMDRNCSTIEEAVEIVERCESILGPDDRKRSTVRNIASSETRNVAANNKTLVESELMSQMHNILNRLEKMETKIEKASLAEKDDRKRSGRYDRKFTGCFLCSGMDHYAKDCPRRGQKSENYKPLV